MEVTGALSSRARSASFDFGEDTALVAVQHMLYQTVDMFQAAGEIGLNPENIFTLGKVYSNNGPIISTLRDMGVTVLDSTFPRPGEFDASFGNDVKRLWRLVAERLAQRRIKRVLVLDDGGKCITNIPAQLLHRYQVAGVEQTSLGMFVFEDHPPPFAVVSWARSAVKLRIGGPIFSHCLINRLHAQFLRGNSLQDVEVGIIGLGSIGSGLADGATRQQSKVLFYDPNPNLEVPPRLRHQITRVDSLEELMLRCQFVFGASGRDPFKGKWPMRYRPGIRLFSGSAGDQEFGPIIRDLRERACFKVENETWDITCEDGPSGPIHIAYQGFPYNFVSRGESAVPSRIVQIETGGLLAGLIQAHNHLTLVENGLADNSGVHRSSLEAQRFLLGLWLETMQHHDIDIKKRYGYDSTMLAATKHRDWFDAHSEPRPGLSGTSCRAELMMRSILEHDLRAVQ